MDEVTRFIYVFWNRGKELNMLFLKNMKVFFEIRNFWICPTTPRVPTFGHLASSHVGVRGDVNDTRKSNDKLVLITTPRPSPWRVFVFFVVELSVDDISSISVKHNQKLLSKRKHVLLPGFLTNLNVVFVHRSHNQATVCHELHVARPRRLHSRRIDVVGKVFCGYDPFLQRQVEVW